MSKMGDAAARCCGIFAASDDSDARGVPAAGSRCTRVRGGRHLACCGGVRADVCDLPRDWRRQAHRAKTGGCYRAARARMAHSLNPSSGRAPVRRQCLPVGRIGRLPCDPGVLPQAERGRHADRAYSARPGGRSPGARRRHDVPLMAPDLTGPAHPGLGSRVRMVGMSLRADAQGPPRSQDQVVAGRPRAIR